jgi:hypothetical protein
MSIGRLYPVAVALVVGAMLGAVSVGWNTLGATEDNPNGARNSGPATRGAEGLSKRLRGSRRPS